MIFRGARGQTELIPITIQFSKGDGTAIDPTGSVELRVYYSAAGVLVLKATLAPVKQASLTGFYGAFLDVSAVATFPAGDYVLRWAATVDGVAAAAQDTLEIGEAASIPGTGAASGAYCSESEIRDWTQPLEDVANVSSALISEMAARGADRIDARLRGMYVVPFTAAYDHFIVQLNIWIAASYLLENRQGQAGNLNDLARQLAERFDEEIARILSGEIVLTVDPRTDTPSGQDSSSASSTDGATRVYDWDVDNPGSSPIGRY